MNIKKIVSAISALAISVSAFAGMAVVGHAETTTLYERGYETAWTADDATAWGATELAEVTTKESSEATKALHQSGGNGDNEAKMTVTPETNSILNIEAEWLGMSNTGRAFSAGNASYFRFGNIYVMQNDQDKLWGYTLTAETPANAPAMAVTQSTAVNVYRNYDTAAMNWYVISIEIDTASNTLNYFRVYSSANRDSAIVDISKQPLLGTDYSTISIGYEKGGGVSTTNNEYLKSIKVTQTTQTVATADYTINYVLDEDTVKTVTDTNVVGNTVDAETVFTENGVKYFVTDDATTSMTLVAGENILNVPVRVANNYTVTVNATGTVSQTLKTIENVVEGETASYKYPRYIVNGSTLNQVVLSRYDQGFQGSVSNVTADTTADITYAEVADTTVAYYSEAEDIEGAVAATSGNIPVRCSDGTAAYFPDDAETEEADSTIITTLPAGKYVLTAGTFGNTGAEFVFSAGDNVILTANTLGYFAEATGDEFTLTEDTVITVAAEGNAGSSPKVIDYVLIKKTGDVVPVVTANLEADFADETATDAQGASVWSAIVNGEGTLDVVVTDTEGNVGAVSGNTTVSGGADVSVIIIVNKMASLLDSVLVSIE